MIGYLNVRSKIIPILLPPTPRTSPMNYSMPVSSHLSGSRKRMSLAVADVYISRIVHLRRGGRILTGRNHPNSKPPDPQR